MGIKSLYKESTSTTATTDRIKYSIMLNSLPNDRISDLSKLQAFADENNYKCDTKIDILFRVENIVGKQENPGYELFLLFPQCFQKFFY